MRDYVSLTWKEFEALDRSRTIIVLPVGSVEQHGPHLPLDTDSLIALCLANRLSETFTDLHLVVAPPFRYTYAKPSSVFPGTLSTEGKTLVSLTRDVLRSFLGQRFEKILILNAHLENTDFLIEGISLALEGRDHAKIVLCNWWEMVSDKEMMALFGPDWKGWVDEHAALVETSLLLSIAPEEVRKEEMIDDSRKNRFEFRVFPWNLAYYPTSGVFSRTSGASREKGERLIGILLKETRGLIEREFLRGRMEGGEAKR